MYYTQQYIRAAYVIHNHGRDKSDHASRITQNTHRKNIMESKLFISSMKIMASPNKFIWEAGMNSQIKIK